MAEFGELGGMELEEDRTDVYSSGDDGSSMVMSERVKALAASIYGEFEAMIQKYDQDVVSGLMPIIVSVLEQLDASYGDSHEQNLELEMLQDDNEQLMNQYEREKQLRKLAENKYLEMEDQIEQDYREKQNLLEKTEHQNRQLEAKIKNYQDHIERLDERIAEMKREYNALHQRHAEMVHHYMERIERAEKGKFSPAHPMDNSGFKAGRHRTLSSSIGGSKSDTVIVTPTGQKEDGMNQDDMMSAHEKNQAYEKNKLSLRDESKMLEDEKMEVTSTTDEKAEPGVCVATSTTNLIPDTPSQEPSVEKSKEDTAATCQVTDVDNMAIMNTDEAADMLSPTKKAWANLSSEAQAILASTPELSTENDVPLRTSSRAKERPVSLDLETLPEGVNAESLFAELSNEEPEIIQELDEGADITAMGKELEILMNDNKELLAAKSKLITQKNDLLKRLEEISSEKEVLKDEVSSLQAMKGRMNYRISELEQEVKMLKHETEKAQVALKEANVSAAHRKRFTRVEMARVLMERNQYKERLMELQEAVRWTEMIRASKEKNLEMQRKKKSGVWKFFNSLFSASPDKKPTSSTVSIRYNSPGSQDMIDAPMQRKQTYTGYGLERQRLMEKRERYKQVRAAHLSTVPSGLGENRLQAYGWSLPATYSSESMESGGKNLISVPVPVYCRPLNINEPGMKIWCAAGVDLTGGRTRDGGSAIGGSAFYADGSRSDDSHDIDGKEAKVSIVWIGSSTHSCSKVTIIDANCPQKILDCFVVCTTHLLCIASVPGARESDYEVDLPQAHSSTESPGLSSSNRPLLVGDNMQGSQQSLVDEDSFSLSSINSTDLSVSGQQSSATASSGDNASTDGTVSATVMGVSGTDGSSGADPSSGVAQKMSSVLPTMWLGAQSGCVYVHSALSHWRTCIHSIRLKDSVLSIVHVKGRVLAALADGTIAIFHRSQDGQWDFSNYHLLDLGRPHHSIRCMAVVYEKVWCGYRNKIQVIHPRTLKIEKTFDAHPRRESQVRQLAWIGDGVWVSIRLDSTLRLYNAHTYHHLQDIDIEPYVSKMLGTGKLGFSFVRITALLLTSDRLWVGTGNGVILSVPLVAAIPARDSGETKSSASTDRPASPALTGPGGAVRVYSNGLRDGDTTSASFMPYCSMVNAQLSFHGHKDSVKFFVCVPGSVKPPGSIVRQAVTSTSEDQSATPETTSSTIIKQNSLVLSGGEGYIDFRTNENEDGADDDRNSDDFISAQSKAQTTSEKSHLMVWQVASQ